jgi:hypothetical protein
MTTLLFELFLGYLAVSAVVTFALVRLFRRTEEKATTAVLVEFKPQPLRGPRADDDLNTTHRRAA